jgi:hypothetical protein
VKISSGFGRKGHFDELSVLSRRAYCCRDDRALCGGDFLECVHAEFSSKAGSQIVVLENMENAAGALVTEKNGAAYRNRTDT